MNALKNLVTAGSFQDKRVPEDDEIEKYIGFVRQTDMDSSSVSTQDHHSCRSRRTPTIVTYTKFDNDEVFVAVARTMLYRFEYEKLNEREAIQTTLAKSEDLRAFLEALDMKYATVYSYDEDVVNLMALEIIEMVHQIRSIFLPTLRAMWEEIDSTEIGPSNDATTGEREEPQMILDIDGDYYRKPPRTPKNLRLSPVECAYKSHYDMEMDDGGICIQTPSKRPRRWFFSESDSDRTKWQPGASSAVNPFASGKKFPELRFEFVGKQTVTNMFAPKRNGPIVNFGFGSRFSTSKPVQSLQLDGLDPVMGTYMPPTSPIRTVSNDLNVYR